MKDSGPVSYREWSTLPHGGHDIGDPSLETWQCRRCGLTGRCDSRVKFYKKECA